LTNKVHFKEAIQSTFLNKNSNLLIVLSVKLKVYFLDIEVHFIILINNVKQGNLISILPTTRLFTCLTSHDNKLYLGSTEGSISVFEIASLKNISEIPYFSHKKKAVSIQ
jgi:hypothetical protein